MSKKCSKECQYIPEKQVVRIAFLVAKFLKIKKYSLIKKSRFLIENAKINSLKYAICQRTKISLHTIKTNDKEI